MSSCDDCGRKTKILTRIGRRRLCWDCFELEEEAARRL